MATPSLPLEEFLRAAGELGVEAVELRNDLPGIALADGAPTAEVRAAVSRSGMRVLSINALQRFNEWTPEREAEARALARQAAEVGAEALVLCPVNEEGWRAEGSRRHESLVEALRGLSPILREAGLIGLVEPLGFAECSLRRKADAVAAIDEAGAADRFKLVHDTFHHVVAGEREIFPARTGLVHISGVEDGAVPVDAMRDPHRVLVGPGDRLDNTGQMRALVEGGYRGAFSFEPFAREVAESDDPVRDLRASMTHVASALEGADA
ncbi:xylose isomerase [Aureimonas flava]|uniref:Xylose isomerase n=2 Tax=Aureimonas flava TaxID=2320271 RepID=A0A3A1WQ66_9HYPH|nr:TIM barrel protein [Aureimonas flava]RIX99681.1 xylose isomerase [Aureimonas flava]